MEFFMKSTFLFLFCFLSNAFGASATELYDPLTVYLTWQRSPESTMTIQWISELDRTEDVVEYQPTDGQEWFVAKGAHTVMPGGHPYYIHRVELTSLKSNTDYYFRPGVNAVTFKFRTMPSELTQPIRFVVGGDIYHDDLDILGTMNRIAAQSDPQFALLGGDITYACSKYSFFHRIGLIKENKNRWMDWLIAWKKQMVTSDGRLIPIIPALGNHDTMGYFDQTPAQAEFFYALFPMAGYHVLDFGQYMSLFILDSGHTHPVKGPQTHWLADTLSKRQHIPHKFALYHVGAYPSVRDFNGERSQAIRTYWVPLFEQYHLDVAFENHDHAFKRSHLIRNGQINPMGVLYMGDGAWGVSKPRTPKLPQDVWYLAKTLSTQYVLVVTIDPTTRSFVALGPSKNIIDAYTQNLIGFKLELPYHGD